MFIPKVAIQLEQILRSILGYRGISKINYDGRKFRISYILLLKSYIVKKREISCSLVDRMTYIIEKFFKKFALLKIWHPQCCGASTLPYLSHRYPRAFFACVHPSFFKLATPLRRFGPDNGPKDPCQSFVLCFNNVSLIFRHSKFC